MTLPLLLLTLLPLGAPKREIIPISYGPAGSVKKVNLTVVLPPKIVKEKTCPVILALPFASGDAEMVTRFLDLWEKEGLRRGYILLCPEIMGRDLETEAKELIPAIFASLEKKIPYDKNRAFLVGSSNGGVGAFFTILAHPNLFRALLVMPGGYEGPAENLKVLKGKAFWLLCGANDRAEWKEFAQATKKGLDAAGVEVLLEFIPGQGHILDVPAKKRFDWFDGIK